MFRVCFCVRSDFEEKFGGDTLQIQKYAESLSAQNVVVDILTLEQFCISRDIYDLYLLVNVDRCYETIEFYRRLGKRNLLSRMGVVPIHHDDKAQDAFNAYRLGRLYHFLPGGYRTLEKLKSLFRSGFSINRLASSLYHAVFLNYRAQMIAVFENSRLVICIAEGEEAAIEKDFEVNIHSKCIVIRNGVSSDFVSSPRVSLVERDIDVLVCGRIEQRKNQLMIAERLKDTNLNVVFLGGENKSNNDYCEKFKVVVRASKNMSFVGKVAADQVYDYYLRSKVHLSASWVEVSSLVDLEAYSCGCAVISSINGHTKEILSGRRFFLFNPSDELELERLVEEGRDCYGFSDSDVKVLSWGASLEPLYPEILRLCNEDNN